MPIVIISCNYSIIAAELDKDSYSLSFPDDGSRLVFKGKTKKYASAGHTEEVREYNVDIELFDKVLGDKVKSSLTGKSLFFTVPKKGAPAGLQISQLSRLTTMLIAELKIEYWPRLTKDKKKIQWIKTGRPWSNFTKSR